MSEPAKIVVLSHEELETLIERAVERALKVSGNGHGQDDRLLGVDEAARFLGYSKDWIYRNQKRIGGRKIGKRGVRFSRQDLAAWAASRKTGSPS